MERGVMGKLTGGRRFNAYKIIYMPLAKDNTSRGSFFLLFFRGGSARICIVYTRAYYLPALHLSSAPHSTTIIFPVCYLLCDSVFVLGLQLLDPPFKKKGAPHNSTTFFHTMVHHWPPSSPLAEPASQAELHIIRQL